MSNRLRRLMRVLGSALGLPSRKEQHYLWGCSAVNGPGVLIDTHKPRRGSARHTNSNSFPASEFAAISGKKDRSHFRPWWILVVLLPLSLQTPLAEDTPGDVEPYKGLENYDGTNSFGPDTVDLWNLGLNVRQELSASFDVNGLGYQVVANYSGTGTDLRDSIDFNPSLGSSGEFNYYMYFSPETVWGPLGAGWSVHMGKLLSSGLVLDTETTDAEQCGFDDDHLFLQNQGLTSVCDLFPKCTSTPDDDRNLRTIIVDRSGVRHPMTELIPFNSTDYSWIRADLDRASLPPYSRCHRVKGWRTPDGTLHEVNDDGLVTQITDLSGNWIKIEYFNPNIPGDFPFCDDQVYPCESYRDYGVTRSKLYKVRTRDPEPFIYRDVAWPLKRIHDSHGREINFELSTQPIGGKYRIKRVRYTSPSQQGEAVYELNYEERDLYNAYGNPDIPGRPFQTPCTDSGHNCFGPEMRSHPNDGTVITGVAFLVQVIRPDNTTVEYDYYPWGDLKSIRTVHGGVIEYKWAWSQTPDSVLSDGGINPVYS